jgi:hypothetical protein
MSLMPILAMLQDCVATLVLCIQDHGQGATTFIHGVRSHDAVDVVGVVGLFDYNAMWDQYESSPLICYLYRWVIRPWVRCPGPKCWRHQKTGRLLSPTFCIRNSMR